MAIMSSFVSSFAILAVVTFSQIQCTTVDGVNQDVESPRLLRSSESVRTILDPKGSFLAGEDTPVWLAYREDPRNSTFTYAKLEQKIVKQAIEYWKSDEFQGITRRARSIKDNMSILENISEDLSEPEVIKNSNSSVSHKSKRPKRQDKPLVFHPSVLAVMEYDGDWPSDENAQRKLILEKIIYALAFWYGVDLQLRPIENPRVRIRLSGIVIGRDKEATNHLLKYRDPVVFDYKASLENIIDYWGIQVRKDNKDFRRGVYNVVGLMTDALPAEEYKYATSTHGPPCDYDVDEPTGALVVYDNLRFEGLQNAVHMMARILGQGTDNGKICHDRRDWDGRIWTPCDLDVIRASLENDGWCLAIAKEFHRPGKAVETILPGKVLPATKQCIARGWQDGFFCSKNAMKCNSLICANDRWYSKCAYAGIPLDGTECYDGMMCLHGECVINSTLTYT